MQQIMFSAPAIDSWDSILVRMEMYLVGVASRRALVPTESKLLADIREEQRK